MFPDVTGLILAGGKSSRMGTNKCLIPVGGVPVIQRTADLLRSLFPYVLVSTNAPKEFEFLGLPCVADACPDGGPLAGISAGLRAASTERVFVISCDLPLMTREVIVRLVNEQAHTPIVAASVDGRLQPLCGVYSHRFLRTAERVLSNATMKPNSDKSDYRLRDLLTPENATLVEFARPGSENVDAAFLNMNSPDDHRRMVILLDDLTA